MSKSNILQLPVTHTISPVTAPAPHPNRLLARDAVATWRERKRVTGEKGEGQAAVIEAGVSPTPELPTEPATKREISLQDDSTVSQLPSQGENDAHGAANRTAAVPALRPKTGNRLEVSDGVVWEGGKRSMSTRSMMARILAVR